MTEKFGSGNWVIIREEIDVSDEEVKGRVITRLADLAIMSNTEIDEMFNGVRPNADGS